MKFLSNWTLEFRENELTHLTTFTISPRGTPASFVGVLKTPVWSEDGSLLWPRIALSHFGGGEQNDSPAWTDRGDHNSASSIWEVDAELAS